MYLFRGIGQNIKIKINGIQNWFLKLLQEKVLPILKIKHILFHTKFERTFKHDT